MNVHISGENGGDWPRQLEIVVESWAKKVKQRKQLVVINGENGPRNYK